jgi:hypothetical protein
MAKGKHSTALFEVIHTAKRPPKASPTGGIATPQWWFKSKKRSGNLAGSPPQSSFFARWSAAKSESAAKNESPQISERAVEPPIIIERRLPDVEPAPLADPAPPSLKKAAGEIKFKLSYGGAIAAAFVLVLLLAIVYLAGSRSPQPGLAETTAPDSSSSKTTAPASDGTGFLAAVTPGSKGAEVHRVIDTTPLPRSSAPAQTAPIVTPGKVVRQVGLHYVIAQSYANKELAQKACDFLNQSGIACTVVQGPPGWAVSNWFSVIGVKSFDHVQHNPELESYKRQVEALGVKFAGNIRFNRFEPNAYKWREEANQQE